VLARGELDLLAMVCKFALYQLNRQSETYAREGVGLPLSALCGGDKVLLLINGGEYQSSG
jgi:hypothetical protein